MDDLKLRLTEKKRTQRELAHYLGIEESTISKWNSGRPIPKKYHDQIATFLEMGKPTEAIGKKQIMEFVSKLIPNGFECRHISMTFTDDYTAVITLTNMEDEEDED